MLSYYTGDCMCGIGGGCRKSATRVTCANKSKLEYVYA